MTPVPDTHVLPAPPALTAVLHVITLTLHLAAMNFMFGGLAALFMARVDDRWRRPATVRFVRMLPAAMAGTVTLGVAPLLFVQLSYPRAIYSASITSAWFWIAIVAAVITAYAMLYAASFGIEKRPGRSRAFLGVAVLAMTYVSLVYSAVFSMAERPDLIGALYAASPHGGVFNPRLDQWLPRWAHMVTGALTVGAYALALVARDDEPLAAAGRRVFLGAAVAAMLLGVVYLVSLSEHMASIMRPPAVVWLTASVIAALGAMHFVVRRRMGAGGALLLASLAGMVALRHAVRSIVLPREYGPADVPVHPQWGVFALFVVCFALAAGAIAWMVRVFVRGRGQEADTAPGPPG